MSLKVGDVVTIIDNGVRATVENVRKDTRSDTGSYPIFVVYFSLDSYYNTKILYSDQVEKIHE